MKQVRSRFRALWLTDDQYRDIMNALPFLVQIWLFITPVAYSSDLIPQQWQFVYGLNPMAGVVEGFRWTLLGEADPPKMLMLASIIMTLLLLISGLYFFKKREDFFVDLI